MNYKTTALELERQLKEFVKNKKAIVGVSGGIDSAVVATLCKNALGKEKVIGLLMPYGNQDMKDAKKLVKLLGIENHEINIKKLVDEFNFLNPDPVTKGNIMARIRMVLLYLFSNKNKGLVMGTGNKSEIELGYFTKYGDGGVDIEPIGDLYKTEIYKLAEILGLPKEIINKKPSAGLLKGQTDEKDIGASYSEIDAILEGEINHGEIYEKIQKRKRDSEHKRKSPPIFNIRK